MLTTTGSGLSDLLVIATSAEVTVLVVSVSESLPGVGSDVAPSAVAVLEIDAVTLELTFTTTSKVAVAPEGTDAFENTMSPVPPTDTLSVRDQPDDDEAVTAAETNVVPLGTPSVTVTVLASLGPLFWKLIV